jgi:hypothetical protein
VQGFSIYSTFCILASCGEGFINIFQQQNANNYSALAAIPTAQGARTSLFVPELNRFYVAIPHIAKIDNRRKYWFINTNNTIFLFFELLLSLFVPFVFNFISVGLVLSLYPQQGQIIHPIL